MYAGLQVAGRKPCHLTIRLVVAVMIVDMEADGTADLNTKSGIATSFWHLDLS